jgi:hypothetical protein
MIEETGNYETYIFRDFNVYLLDNTNRLTLNLLCSVLCELILSTTLMNQVYIFDWYIEITISNAMALT